VKYLPYAIVGVLFVVIILMMQRNRRRQVEAETARSDQIGPGTDVMTTAGLYGTVRAKNDDGTVELEIADGVRVRWAMAALRDAASLSDRYRPGLPGGGNADRPLTVDDDDAPTDLADGPGGAAERPADGAETGRTT
jgi:preprotein translocase subunit YajC